MVVARLSDGIYPRSWFKTVFHIHFMKSFSLPDNIRKQQLKLVIFKDSGDLYYSNPPRLSYTVFHLNLNDHLVIDYYARSVRRLQQSFVLCR